MSASMDAAANRSGLVVLCPMRVEKRAVAAGAVTAAVVRTGAGMARATAAADRLLSDLSSGRAAAGAIAVAGVAGGLVAGLAPGTIVVADRVIDSADGTVVAELPSAALVAAALNRRGVNAVTGPVATSARLVRGSKGRAELARTGAIAVDMETSALVRTDWDRPVAVIRAIADTAGRELGSPSIISGGRLALAALKAAVPVLEEWAAAIDDRSVVLAGPRSFCAGVERAIETVNRALDRFGAPVYVRRQIVHNRHVVRDLEERGAVFVHELDEVPDGATVVFSAHGVAPTVRAAATQRDLDVIDATCPLVAKVHHEVHRFTNRGFQVLLIGHAGHDETEGTLGEHPELVLVESEADVAGIDVRDPERVAYITQTTLSPSDVSTVVGALSERFPSIVGPSAGDICYATQNRQEGVRAIAADCDLMVVVGSANSSNTARLVEVSERAGCPAVMVDDESDLRLESLRGVRTVGVTAGASAPPVLVDRVIRALSGLGPLQVEERAVRTENVNFPLPVEVR